MPRISISESMLPAIGKVIGEASIDPVKRQELKDDPAAALRNAGVPESSLEGLALPVLEDTEDTVHLVIPFQADAAKVGAGDEAYLTLLGTVAVMGCFREFI